MQNVPFVFELVFKKLFVLAAHALSFEFAFSLGIFPHFYLIEFVLICFRYFLYLISTCIYHPTSAPTAPIQLASEKSADVIYI